MSKLQEDVTGKSDDKMSADAGIRTRVLTLARSSDNQLHYVRNKCVDSIDSYKLYPIRDNHVQENES